MRGRIISDLLSWTSLPRTKAKLVNKLEASPTVVEQGLFFTDIKNLLATDPRFDNESRFTNKYSFIFLLDDFYFTIISKIE
jgi:hypothetical protein